MRGQSRPTNTKKVTPRSFSHVLVLALVVGLFTQVGPAQAAGTISLTTLGGPTPRISTPSPAAVRPARCRIGWDFLETGINANTTYTAGTGSGNAGDTYSFGAAASTERAFGRLLSGSLTPVIGAQFTNNTGATITSLDIAYTGEQWRAGVENRGAADRLDFQLSTDATSLSTGTGRTTTASTSTATNAPARTAMPPAIATRSFTSRAEHRQRLSFWIRWADFNISLGRRSRRGRFLPHTDPPAAFRSTTSAPTKGTAARRRSTSR